MVTEKLCEYEKKISQFSIEEASIKTKNVNEQKSYHNNIAADH